MTENHVKNLRCGLMYDQLNLLHIFIAFCLATCFTSVHPFECLFVSDSRTNILRFTDTSAPLLSYFPCN